MKKSTLLLIGLLAMGGFAHMQAANIVTNGSFETLGTTQLNYSTPFGSFPLDGFTGWTLGASTGASYDGIVTTAGGAVCSNDGNPIAIADGTNAVFLQGTGSISQQISLDAGTYTLSFSATGRAAGTGINPVDVTISGNVFSQQFTPTHTDGNTSGIWDNESATFTVSTAGNYTLTFAGVQPYSSNNDYASYIDNVSIVAAVPEPASMALLGVSAIGLLGWRTVASRKRSRA